MIPRQHSTAASPAFHHVPQLAKRFGQRSPVPTRPGGASSPLSYPNAAKQFPNATPKAQALIGSLTQVMGVTVKREWIKELSEILRDKKNEGISIEFGQLKVNSALLANAAKAIEEEKVLILFDPYNVLKGDGVATYYHELRLIQIVSSFIHEKFERSTLLHEAVHLLIHQSGAKRVLLVESEIVCFLAQTMYFLVNGWEKDELFKKREDTANPQNTELLNSEPLRAAWDLAEFLIGKLEHDFKKGGLKRSGGNRPGDDPATYHTLVSALRAAIRNCPAYAVEANSPPIDYTPF